MSRLGRLQAPDLARVGLHHDAQLFGELVEVDAREQLFDGLGAHARFESAFAVLVADLAEALLGQELVFLELRVTGIDHHVAFEVQDALEVAQRQVEQVTDTARQAFEEPDVGDGAGQLDVAHALAAHPRTGDLDTALVAHHTAVLHALVLAAQALPIGDRTEDLGAEKAVALRLEGAVVDGLGLGDLAVAPRKDLLG